MKIRENQKTNRKKEFKCGVEKGHWTKYCVLLPNTSKVNTKPMGGNLLNILELLKLQKETLCLKVV